MRKSISKLVLGAMLFSLLPLTSLAAVDTTGHTVAGINPTGGNSGTINIANSGAYEVNFTFSGTLETNNVVQLDIMSGSTVAFTQTGAATAGSGTYKFTGLSLSGLTQGVITFSGSVLSGSTVVASGITSNGLVDTVAPTASITYNPNTLTGGIVTATLTGASEIITVTNNTGALTYIFSNTGTFTFEFQDASGNTGSTTATVTDAMLDKVAPTIALNGSGTMTIERLSTYTDLGAVYTDNSATGAATYNSGGLNTSVVGTYTGTYNYSDIAGNAATQVTRTVTVVDRTAPTITQVNPISTNTTDTTPNYTFSSNEVGVITYSGACTSSTTSASIGSNTVTFSTLAAGTYSNCTIKVTDSSSNVSNIITVSPFTVITGVSNTVTLKTGWNVFSTPKTLQTIAFSNAGAGLTFYKLEGGVYSQVSVSTSTIVPLAGFLVNNTNTSDVDVYLTNKTGLTANQRLHQKSLSAGWHILGTVTNTTPFDTIGAKATAKIDLTNGSTNPNAVNSTFSSSITGNYQLGEAYGVFMSEAGIYGGNENN